MDVAILGASDKPQRYSYQALHRLLEAGHRTLPVHPRLRDIEGTPVYADLADVPRPVHTVTVYVSPSISDRTAEALLALRPRRVIFNPGAENPVLQRRLAEAGVEVVEACTLVMLRTGQFAPKTDPA